MNLQAQRTKANFLYRKDFKQLVNFDELMLSLAEKQKALDEYVWLKLHGEDHTPSLPRYEAVAKRIDTKNAGWWNFIKGLTKI